MCESSHRIGLDWPAFCSRRHGGARLGAGLLARWFSSLRGQRAGGGLFFGGLRAGLHGRSVCAGYVAVYHNVSRVLQ